MYELIMAIGNSFYIESPAKIGLIDSGVGVGYLIDSGSDKSAGKMISGPEGYRIFSP